MGGRTPSAAIRAGVRAGGCGRGALTLARIATGANGGGTPDGVGTTSQTKHALDLRGFADAPIENVALADCDFGGVTSANVVENVRNLSLKNVKINGKMVERAG